MTKYIKFRNFTCGVILSILSLGCADEQQTDLPARQPTHGTITYNGEVPNGAVIQLWPLPIETVDWRTIKPAGRVGPDGKFDINTYELSDGAIAGEYLVTVLWTGENPDLPMPDLFKGRYSDPSSPVMKVTISDGDNQLPPIVLKGPPVSESQAWVDPVTQQQ